MALIEKENSIRDPSGGGNQSGLRDQNARLILSYIARHGQMSAAELARRSGLSAQTVSNIVRSLETDAILLRGAAVKGKVGKPSVPMALNPNGVYSYGLSIGRRSAELVLVDFLGNEVDKRRVAYRYPEIEGVFDFLEDAVGSIQRARPAVRDGARVAGIGVALPNRIWSWHQVVDAPPRAMRAWQDLDPKAEIGRRTGLEVFIENDATSACVAEHLLGRGREFSDFAYIFVGAFVGGGLVLGGKVVPGVMGNAAALGPLPVPDEDGAPTQLLNKASLHVLESSLARRGIGPEALREANDGWERFEAELGPWIASTARYLAIAAVSIASVVDVEAILLDGAMPVEVRARLTQATQEHLKTLDLTGLEDLTVSEAEVGRGARPIGAALLPIHARYFLA